MKPQSDGAPDAPSVSGWPDVDGEKLLDALADFAAGAAHEFNNPLTVISGRAQLMAEHATGDDRDVWQTMVAQAQRISETINRLMTFSSPPPPRPERIDLAACFDEIISEVFQNIPPNAAAPRCDKNVEGRPVAWADPTQIRQAIDELLANALQACESGCDIRMTACDLPDGRVQLTVCDDGPGMTRMQLHKALLPFVSHRRAGGRGGLGLPLAWRLVVNNGGRLQVTSQPGEGTVVDMTLPAAEVRGPTTGSG